MTTPSVGFPSLDLHIGRLLDDLAAARSEAAALRRALARAALGDQEGPPPELCHAWRTGARSLPITVAVDGREVIVVVDGPPRPADPARELADWALLRESIRSAMREG